VVRGSALDRARRQAADELALQGKTSTPADHDQRGPRQEHGCFWRWTPSSRFTTTRDRTLSSLCKKVLGEKKATTDSLPSLIRRPVRVRRVALSRSGAGLVRATPDGQFCGSQPLRETRMTNRSLAVLFGAFALLAAPLARAESPAGKAGNEMEKKGNAAEKSADAEKAKGKKMQKKGEAMEEAGDKADNKAQEDAGKKLQKKGKAVEKSGEARHEAAEDMEKSGAKVEKAGAKAEKDSAKAKADAQK
jgi:hypothetical protein